MKRSIVTASKVVWVSLVLVLVLFVSVIISSLIGAANIGVLQGLKGLLYGWHEGAALLTDSEKTILFSVRLPRIVFAGIVGASLSSAGVIFQGLLRNPLAEPFILGVSGGAAVGAIAGILLGIAAIPFGVPFLAFSGSAVTVILVFLVGKGKSGINSQTLLLAGVIINAFFSAIIMFLISISSRADLHNITFWLMGDLSLAYSREIVTAGIFLMGGFLIVYAYARPLNLIVGGEETAMQLGVNVERTKIVLFLAGSLMTAVAVSFAGIIGFVGLIVPHMMRMLLGPDHRLLMPASFLFGATFLVVADTIARTLIAHAELPVGVVTALCGAPYFIYLLKTRVV
ncbi:MAG: iron chelate uptake ABC transporter family permease subunit [Thermodesulfobacteriota bacterium]|nr:iron chelate uptake ABC transporter family permease subunit [Thermodesulfobacteriota bacterium]